MSGGAGAPPPVGHAPEGEAAGPAPKVRRLRAPRTTAAVVVATVLLILALALLYDVVAVRTGQPARQWRTDLADELATRHLDDLAVLLGAGATTLLGGWLLWLALAPGLGRWLPLRPHGDTAAAIDRSGVAALLADRAAGLPGVEHLKVRINRRRVRIALVGPADPASVQRQLRAELAAVTLAGPLRLDVRTAGRRRAGAGPVLEEEPVREGSATEGSAVEAGAVERSATEASAAEAGAAEGSAAEGGPPQGPVRGGGGE
ncbi:DUF6286 domain-containing protein [Kitasatospora purpeofusca]|uniref:DUF6286 domain-containing protein n=1 Tax=Kitasatospora purpeofusca TaxID=67352 RepID=UPI002A5A63EB|nr:DUF6286 domain-containing protein [Kitasatospora purpeofusca]MDY0814217.1 DUF6286 domain-containing protein [Kitasatospora purpeofusca]